MSTTYPAYTNQPPSTIQFMYSCEGERTILTAVVNFGASGIVSDALHGLQQWNPTKSGSIPGKYSDAAKTGFGPNPPGTRGIALVTRVAAGDFVFQFQGNFQRCLGVSMVQVSTGGVNGVVNSGGASTAIAPLAIQQVLTAPATLVQPGTPNPIEVLLTSTAVSATGLSGTAAAQTFTGAAPSANPTPITGIHGAFTAQSGTTPAFYTQNSATGGQFTTAAAGALVGGTIFDTTGNGGVIVANSALASNSGTISIAGLGFGTPATASTLIITPPPVPVGTNGTSAVSVSGTGTVSAPLTDPASGSQIIFTFVFDKSTS